MATYVNDLRLKEIATGDESGTWGTSTNTNLELIAEGFSYATVDPFDTDADKTETMADGATDPIRSLYLKVTSTATLTATRTLTLAPNTVSKVWIIENATTGGQSINISQGSGSNVTIPNGDVKVIYTDGAGATAAVTDAFANLKVTDAAQTNITSVGTLSSLTVSGDLTVDTTTLYVDSTNNRVGVGTSSPANGKLEIASSSNQLQINTGDETANGRLDIGHFNNGTFIGTYAGTNAGANLLRLGTSGTEAMRIDSSGNVGIGAASPNTKLDVIGSSTNGSGIVDTLRLRNTGSTINDGARIQFTAGTSTSGAGIGSGGQALNSADLRFYAGGNTERMRIDTSGNVGIGTSSPAGNLHISGSGDRSLLITGGTAGTTSVQMGDSADQDAGAIKYDNSNNSMQFVSNASERMRIDSSGNVGIGSTSPTELLTLRNADPTLLIQGNQVSGVHYSDIDFKNQAGSVLGTIGLSYYGGPAEFYRNVPTSWSHVWKVNSSERMRIDSSGNVGIGTSSPASKLHIAASSYTAPTGGLDTNINLLINNTQYSGIQILGSSTGSSFIHFGDQNNADVGIITYEHNGDYMRFDVNATERMRINSSGDVQLANSIGSGTYNGVINAVANKGSGAIIKTRNGDGNDHIHLIGDSNIKYGALGLSTSVGSADAVLEANLNLRFNTGGTNERMRIASDGKILLGTSSSYSNTIVQAYSSAATTSVYNSWNGATSGTRFHFEFRDGASATSRGNITTNGANTAYNTSSDARLKDVTGSARGLEVINALNPVSYNWKESGKSDEGLIAQEVQEIVPNAVTQGEDGYYSMDYSKLVTHLVAGMKEQQTLIEQLQAEVALLKGE